MSYVVNWDPSGQSKSPGYKSPVVANVDPSTGQPSGPPVYDPHGITQGGKDYSTFAGSGVGLVRDLTGDPKIDALLAASVVAGAIPEIGGSLESALSQAAHMREQIQYHRQQLALRSQMLTDRQSQFQRNLDLATGRLNFMESEARVRDAKTGQDTTLGQLRIAELQDKLSQSGVYSRYQFGPSGRGQVSDWVGVFQGR